jgi:hypothetical protein
MVGARPAKARFVSSLQRMRIGGLEAQHEARVRAKEQRALLDHVLKTSHNSCMNDTLG